MCDADFFLQVVLSLVFLYDAACVVSAESEGVRKCGTYGTLLGLVEGEVHVVVDAFVAVFVIVVDGGGTMSFFTLRQQAMASTAPAAPRR